MNRSTTGIQPTLQIKRGEKGYISRDTLQHSTKHHLSGIKTDNKSGLLYNLLNAIDFWLLETGYIRLTEPHFLEQETGLRARYDLASV